MRSDHSSGLHLWRLLGHDRRATTQTLAKSLHTQGEGRKWVTSPWGGYYRRLKLFCTVATNSKLVETSSGQKCHGGHKHRAKSACRYTICFSYNQHVIQFSGSPPWIWATQANHYRINRFIIGKQTIVKLSTIVSIASATIVIVKKKHYRSALITIIFTSWFDIMSVQLKFWSDVHDVTLICRAWCDTNLSCME